jgi:hypothetical protein
MAAGTAFFFVSDHASLKALLTVCVIEGCPGGAEIDIGPTPMDVRYSWYFEPLA